MNITYKKSLQFITTILIVPAAFLLSGLMTLVALTGLYFLVGTPHEVPQILFYATLYAFVAFRLMAKPKGATT